jgi:hypothetical protein
VQTDRLVAALRETGLVVEREDGPWDWSAMMAAHVSSEEDGGEAAQPLSQTANEKGDPHSIRVRWAPSEC